MNSLEKRLAETERALFFALTEIYSGITVQDDYNSSPLHQGREELVLSNSTPTTQQEKTNLMASWAGNPLKTRTQAQAWFNSRRAGECPAVGGAEHSSQDTIDENPDPATPTVACSKGKATVTPLSAYHGQVRVGSADSTKRRRARRNFRTAQQHRRSETAEFSYSESSVKHVEKGATGSAADLSQTSRTHNFVKANKKIYF